MGYRGVQDPEGGDGQKEDPEETVKMRLPQCPHWHPSWGLILSIDRVLSSGSTDSVLQLLI